MKARKKGTTEWKEYKEVFDQYGVFQGLETAGYTETAEEECKRLGIPINPDDENQASRLHNQPPHYVSAVLPLECFDLWSEKEEQAEQFAKEWASCTGPIAIYDEWAEFRKVAAKDFLSAFIIHSSASNDAVDLAIDYADKLIKRLKESVI